MNAILNLFSGTNFRANKLGGNRVIGELFQNGDNIFDGIAGADNRDGSNPYLKPKGMGGNIMDGIGAGLFGETFGDIDSIGGAATSTAVSIASAFIPPLAVWNAVTDLGSAVGILARGLASGNFNMTTLIDAGGYAFSAIPGLGAIADVKRFTDLMGKGKKIGGTISNLNKGLDGAVTAAKAGKAGDLIDLTKIGNNLGDLNKLDQWGNLKGLQVKVLDGGKRTTMSMEDALKLYKKDPNMSGLKETLETTVHNYNVGAKNPSLFKNIDMEKLPEQRKLANSWDTAKSNKLKIDGQDVDFKDAVKITDPAELQKVDDAIKEFNKTNGTKFTRESLVKQEKAHKAWAKRVTELESSGLKVIQGHAGGEVKILSMKEYVTELKTNQKALRNVGKEFKQELTTLIKELTDKHARSLGKFSRNVKDTVVTPFMDAFKGVAVA